MIITLEHDGQPCLDSCSEKKLSLDILLPQQSYYPERRIHPVLGNVNTGYVASITTSDAQSEDLYLTDPSTTSRRRRWRLFKSSLLFKRRPSEDSLPLNTSTMDEKPRRRRHNLPVTWAGLSRRWLAGWVLLSLLLCCVVALAVWFATRRAYGDPFFHAVKTEWLPTDSSIYTFPPELFGCCDEPSNSELNVSQVLIPVSQGRAGQHTFTIQGGASGQLTLASSPDPHSPTITYDIAIQSNPPSPNKVSFNQPPPGPDIPPCTDFLIDTPITTVQPSQTGPRACMRFDITMYIPQSLRQLTVNISTPVQITFSPQAHIELDSLSIFITNSHPKSRIDASESVQARSISVEMHTGLIQGLLSVEESLKITNWDGRIQLDIIPNASMDFSSPSTARVETMSHGKVDIHYLRNRAYRKRPIESWHTMGADDRSTGRFDYGFSGFNGMLYSNSSKYNITNPSFWKEPQRLDKDEEISWPIFLGNRTGEDKIYISSGSGAIILPGSSHI